MNGPVISRRFTALLRVVHHPRVWLRIVEAVRAGCHHATHAHDTRLVGLRRRVLLVRVDLRDLGRIKVVHHAIDLLGHQVGRSRRRRPAMSVSDRLLSLAGRREARGHALLAGRDKSRSTRRRGHAWARVRRAVVVALL
jgi:hypothetical protein